MPARRSTLARFAPWAFVLWSVAASALTYAARVFGAPQKTEPDRLYASAQSVWIYREPRRSTQPLGWLRAGTSLRLKSAQLVRGSSCAGRGFVEVEPRGFVCLDHSASLDDKGRYVRAMRSVLADTSSAPHQRPSRRAPPQKAPQELPYHYALSNGAPMYQRLPTPEEAAKAERQLGPVGKSVPLSRWQRGHEALARTQSIVGTDPVPWFLRESGSVLRAHEKTVLRRYIPRGSMLAYTRAFHLGGRTWLLSSDGTVVPADRVRPYRVSTFAGVEPGPKLNLPLAFTRGKPAKRYWRNREGKFQPLKAPWPERTALKVRPGKNGTWANGALYLETLERAGTYPLFVERSKVRLIGEQKTLPAGLGPSEKWIRFSISEGTLVAYRGLDPVYVTLASPGIGGVPRPGQDLIKQSTTPLGRFRITFKHRSRDMSPEQGDTRTFWIAEVPDTQYFQQPFALHTAYWHEDFGEPMSAGCINLSPKDGRWLFRFTDPRLPDGFSGVGTGGPHGRGTVILIVY